jgi:hypothetical protein
MRGTLLHSPGDDAKLGKDSSSECLFLMAAPSISFHGSN